MSILDRYERITFRGRLLDRYTAAALLVAEHRLGRTLRITQGSYNAGNVAASAGTHDGGGAVDLGADGDYDETVRVLRALGFAAWYRSASDGPWPAHIHAVQIGNKALAPGAAKQVEAYLAGRNGLANNLPDTTPRPKRIRPFPYNLYFQVFLGEFWRARRR